MAVDFTLEPAASEAACALLDLLEAGDDPPVTAGGSSAATLTGNSAAAADMKEEEAGHGKVDLTHKNLKRIRKRPGAPRWTVWLAKVVAKVWGDKKFRGRRSGRCGR